MRQPLFSYLKELCELFFVSIKSESLFGILILQIIES